VPLEYAFPAGFLVLSVWLYFLTLLMNTVCNSIKSFTEVKIHSTYYLSPVW